jgi:hypothetical protein
MEIDSNHAVSTPFEALSIRAIATHPEQGWSLLANGVVAFDDGGMLMPDGSAWSPGASIGAVLSPSTGSPSSAPERVKIASQSRSGLHCYGAERVCVFGPGSAPGLTSPALSSEDVTVGASRSG